jgi:DNA polymerase-3 subunit delta'
MAFDSILGHEIPKRILRSAIERGRVAHAYLFHGPEGVGKRTLALEVARALLCRESPGEGCGTCASCRKVRRDSHPDLRVYRCEAGQESVGVEQVRELVEEAGLRPFESRGRVFLVDRVHLLTESAANALLKTLEEPPMGSVLLLVADRITSLPDTVISRCQPVVFQGLPPDEVRRFLVERHSIEEKEAEWLAAFCEGSIGRALRYVEEGWGGIRAEILERLATPGAWGLEAATYLTGLCRPAGKTAAEARARARTVLHLLVLFARDLLVLATGSGEDRLYNRDRAEQLVEMAGDIGFERAMRLLQTLDEGIECLERNVHVELLLESLAFRIGRILAGAPEKQ